MKLRSNERCPIHPNTRSCVCRGTQERKKRSSTWEIVSLGVRRTKDSSVPGGFRYELSPALKRRILFQRIREQENVCALFEKSDDQGRVISPDCPGEFTDLANVTLDHIEPRGMNGSRYDDGRNGENLWAVHHFPCNQVKLSRRVQR